MILYIITTQSLETRSLKIKLVEVQNDLKPARRIDQALSSPPIHLTVSLHSKRLTAHKYLLAEDNLSKGRLKKGSLRRMSKTVSIAFVARSLTTYILLACI